MEAGDYFGVQEKHWVVWQFLVLHLSPIPGPEKSQLVSGEATVAEIEGLEPNTEYIVRVRAHVAGVDGAPASVVVKTGEWTLAAILTPHWLTCPARYLFLFQLPFPLLPHDSPAMLSHARCLSVHPWWRPWTCFTSSLRR